MPESKTDKLPLEISLKANFVRYHILLTFTLCACLMASGYFLIIKPKIALIQQSRAEDVVTLKAEKVKREAYLVQLQEISQRYRRFDKDQLEKFNQILPSEPDIPGLFVQLQSLAAANNLVLSNVSFNESVAGEGVAGNGADKVMQLGIGLNVTGLGLGSYEQLKAFIYALENNLRLFDIQAVYFNPGSPSYNLNLTAYYLAQ